MAEVSAYLRRNVVGLVAIFLALSGGAYAAVTTNSDLATGSVDSRVLAAGAVEGPDIHSAAVGPKKIKLDKLVKFLQTRVNGSCPDGQTVQGILADGSVLCGDDDASAGTITGVTTSGGLTGGGTSGDVDVGIDPAQVQSRVADDCAANEAIRAVGQDGTVACEPVHPGTVTAINAGFGMTGGPIITTGTLSANPTVLQQRIAGSCPANTAISSVAQSGSVGCSASFDVTEHSGRVALAPNNSATLLSFGEMTLRATCSGAGNAVVEIGSTGDPTPPADFLNYQSRSTSSGMIGASVGAGNFATIMDTATNDLGQFSSLTDSFQQIDGSFYGWSTSQPNSGGECQFDASALTF